MVFTRLIARLDIKGPNLIKGISLEGLRVLGNPKVFAKEYYDIGIDEIIYIDAVASLYERNNLRDIVQYTAQNIFVPFTVGGGVRSVEDVDKLLKSGADKIAINTAAIRNPDLITQISKRFGSQCLVLSIQAKQTGPLRWEAYTEYGREHTGLDVVGWAIEGEKLGAGEILLTSVDQEGTYRGFDIDLTKTVSQAVSIPVIASGGMGNERHLIDVIQEGKADAVSMASVLHYKKISFIDLKKTLARAGIATRN